MGITNRNHFGLFVFLLLVGIEASQASSFNISPLRLEMSGQQKTAELSLKNQTTETMAIQVKVLSWSQENGEDVLEESSDVFFSPPITSVPPGETQLVRFRLKRGASSHEERSYRVFAEQLPRPRELEGPGMNMRIRFSIPLFVAAINAVDPKFIAGAVAEENAVRIFLENTGKQHLKVTGASLFDAAVDVREPELAQLLSTEREPVKGNVYVLPGNSAEWLVPIPADKSATAYRAVLETDYYNNTGRGDIRYDGNLWLDVDDAAGAR